MKEQTQTHLAHDRPSLGILLMLIGLALYTFSDALIKALLGNGGYSVQQVTILRSGIRALLLFATICTHANPVQLLKTKQLKLFALRLAISLTYTYIFMYAFSVTNLTNIYTLSYTSALFMTILGALLLSESVSFKRWLAVCSGMVGVLIAIHPDSSSFDMASLIVLMGTFLGALNKILMRKLSTTDHSLTIALYPNILMVFVTVPFLWGDWQPMPWAHWGLFATVGLLSAGGQYAIAQALRYAQVSILAPADYSTLFWTILIDYIWWRLPGPMTLTGAVIIIASNLYILRLSKLEKALQATEL